MNPMKLQEVVFGFEREIAPRIGAFARYIHKQVDVAIEDIGSLDATGNEIYVIGNPGFHNAATFVDRRHGEVLPFPKAVRDYDALEVGLEKRLSNNWGPGQLHAEPPLWQLLGSVAVGRERPHAARTSAATSTTRS